MSVKIIVASCLVTMVGIGLPCAYLTAHLRTNLTPSAPRGVYWYTALDADTPLARGHGVIATVPVWIQQEVQRVAPQVDVQHPWLKHVAGVPGDTVCLTGQRVTINGALVGTRPLLERYALRVHDGCQTLQSREYFLMNPHPQSYDSRYVGAFPRGFITGTVRPVWTW